MARPLAYSTLLSKKMEQNLKGWLIFNQEFPTQIDTFNQGWLHNFSFFLNNFVQLKIIFSLFARLENIIGYYLFIENSDSWTWMGIFWKKYSFVYFRSVILAKLTSEKVKIRAVEAQNSVQADCFRWQLTKCWMYT